MVFFDIFGILGIFDRVLSIFLQVIPLTYNTKLPFSKMRPTFDHSWKEGFFFFNSKLLFFDYGKGIFSENSPQAPFHHNSMYLKFIFFPLVLLSNCRVSNYYKIINERSKT